MKKILIMMVAAFMIGSTQQVLAQKWLGVLNNVLDGVSKSSSDNSTNNTRSSTKKIITVIKIVLLQEVQLHYIGSTRLLQQRSM